MSDLPIEPQAGDPIGAVSEPLQPGGRVKMRVVDIAVGCIILAFGLFAVMQSSEFPFRDRAGLPAAGFFPMVLSVLIVGMALLLVGTRVLAAPDRYGTFGGPSRLELRRSGSVALVTAIAVLLLPRIGFLLAFGLMIAMLLFGVERLEKPGERIRAAVTAVLAPLGAYLVFGVFLGVRLPTGPFGF